MDYIGSKCPVCDRYFHADDDIVVCPQCGTPHHRECYEQLGHCVNQQLHAEGYDYTADRKTETAPHSIICKSCGKENDADAFFCKYCATPLSGQAADKSGSHASNDSDPRDFTNTRYAIPFMDPLGGVPSDTDLGDGVTAGEAAKYVKQNTPYFIRIFSNIKNFNKSKFNFAAALFSGGYMLYRKMYVPGAFVTAIQAAILLLRVYLANAFSSLYNGMNDVYVGASSTYQMLEQISEYLTQLSTTQIFLLYLPSLLNIAQLVMMIVIGLTFNRQYLNHCKKHIIAIKSGAKSDEGPETLLQTSGGVNMPLAISLLITMLIIEYLPMILMSII